MCMFDKTNHCHCHRFDWTWRTARTPTGTSFDRRFPDGSRSVFVDHNNNYS